MGRSRYEGICEVTYRARNGSCTGSCTACPVEMDPNKHGCKGCQTPSVPPFGPGRVPLKCLPAVPIVGLSRRGREIVAVVVV